MFNNPTLHKKSCRSQSAEKQAIRESMAPFAPFPGAIKQSDKSVTRDNKLKAAK